MFRDGNRHVDPVWDLRSELLNKIREVSASSVSKLNCPAHRSRCRATLLIDVSQGSSAWDVVDYCCEDFCRAIAGGMPHPWNHPPGMKKLDRAA